jgi:hypothetical protein
MFFHPATRNFIPGLVESIPISSVRAKLQNVAQFSQIFIGRLHILAICIVISIILQVNVILHYYLIGKALGIDIGWMNYFAIIPMSLMILMIPASINGIGIREQVFIFFFGSVGVSAVLSISLAWIAFGIALAQAGLGGIVFMIRKRVK